MAGDCAHQPSPNARATTVQNTGSEHTWDHGLYFCISIFQKSTPKQSKLTGLKIPHWGGRPAGAQPGLTNSRKPAVLQLSWASCVYPRKFPWQTVAHFHCFIVIFLTLFLDFFGGKNLSNSAYDFKTNRTDELIMKSNRPLPVLWRHLLLTF